MCPVGQQPWRPTPTPDHAWQSVYPHNRSHNSTDQDASAGGHARRHIRGDDGRRVLARVRFKTAGGRRVYAYLVWHERGRRRELYLGEASSTRSREESLRHAWQQVHAHDLGSVAGRDHWTAREPKAGR